MKSIYISATEPRSGKSTIALGLMNLLNRRTDRIGYFKPISNAPSEMIDEDVLMIQRLYHLDVEPADMNPLRMNDVGRLLAVGAEDELLTQILRAFNKIAANSDVVVIEGTDYTGTLMALELDINSDISKTLNAPVLMVASGEGKSSSEIIDQVNAAKESFDEKHCDLIGVVVTKLNRLTIDQTTENLQTKFAQHNIDLLGAIPRNDLLARPRLGEIARNLKAKVMYGKEYLNNLANEPRVAAMMIGNALVRFGDGTLIITPGDREDMILAAMISRVATTYPNISGLVLCGGLEPSDAIKRLIGGLSGFNIPILQVQTDTIETVIRLNKMPVSLYAGDTEKIKALQKDIQTYMRRDEVYRLLDLKRTPKTTPIVFLNNLLERACSDSKRIVLPEGSEERTLKAASRVLSQGVADIILLGEKAAIIEAANRCDAKIDGATIINPIDSDNLDQYSKVYLELRKHKGTIEIQARDTMSDPIFFGTMMVHLGDADGLVSGAEHTTRHTISPAFQIIKTAPGISIVSSVFFMCLEDRVLVYGDCAVNPNPTAEQLAEIAISSAATAASFGFDPMIAMLSYSTGASGVGPEVEHVKEATRLVQEKRPDLKVEGPIQYDAAMDPGTARSKLPDSLVAGKANVFIFPDLNSGNTAYKAVQRSAHAIAVGPVLQGLNKPVNDLSRGCLVEDIVYTIAITAIQAQ